MTPETILKKAAMAGVTIAVSPAGSIKASGCQKQVNQFIPLLRNNKAELIRFLQQPLVEPVLKSCPICNGLNFIHGHKGGYYCIACQADARPGISVKAGFYRSRIN